MAFLAFLLAFCQFGLVVLSVDFVFDSPLRNVALGLMLFTLGIILGALPGIPVVKLPRGE